MCGETKNKRKTCRIGVVRSLLQLVDLRLYDASCDFIIQNVSNEMWRHIAHIGLVYILADLVNI